MRLWASVVVGISACATATAASALARCIRIGWCGVAPSGMIQTKWRAPTRSAARSRRQAASPLSSSTVARAWSRAPPARWTTASTPRSALRQLAGSARSPIASCTRTRSEPSRRGSRTRQRTGVPRAVRRRTTAWPSNPVAPVSKSTIGLQAMRLLGPMAYVIAEPCIGTKDNSCVEVCPVDCIHPTPDEPDYDRVEQLYIDPEECIDCDACVEACPVDAITPEDMVPAEWEKYIDINAAYYRKEAA